MFLAWKEIKHSKGKFALIMAVVALVSYLVYFLTSLAYGLASSYTNGITKWNADHIVLTEASNDNILMSTMSDVTNDDNDDYSLLTVAGEKAKLGFLWPSSKMRRPPKASKTRGLMSMFSASKATAF